MRGIPFALDMVSLSKLIKSAKSPTEAIDENANNNDVKFHPAEKYPCLGNASQQCIPTLSETDYNKLILIALETYVDLKHLNEVRRNLVLEVAPAEPSKMRKMSLDATQQQAKKRIKEEYKNAKHCLIAENEMQSNIVVAISVELGKQYRKDIKYIDAILSEGNCPPSIREKVGSLLEL